MRFVLISAALDGSAIFAIRPNNGSAIKGTSDRFPTVRGIPDIRVNVGVPKFSSGKHVAFELGNLIV